MFKGTYERTRFNKRGHAIEHGIIGIPGNAKQRRKVVREWKAMGYSVHLWGKS